MSSVCISSVERSQGKKETGVSKLWPVVYIFPEKTLGIYFAEHKIE